MPYKNKEDLIARNKRYYNENKEKLKKEGHVYRIKNREGLNAKQKIYYKENHEKVLEYQKKYREEHRDKIRAYGRQYPKDHRDEWNAYYRNKRAKYREEHKEEIEMKKKEIEERKAERLALRPQLEFERGLKRHYGMTKEEYEVLFKSQNGVCAICSKPQSKGRRLAVDHDHETGEVRGLLCDGCNPGIGYFKNDPELLHVAANYLCRKPALSDCNNEYRKEAFKKHGRR